MKPSTCFLVLITIAVFLTSCLPAPQVAPTDIPTVQPPTSTSVPTNTLVPTATYTPRPTATASPVPLIYPLSVETPLPDYNAIITSKNTSNVKLLAEWKNLDGSGKEAYTLVTSPDGRWLAVSMYGGNMLLVDPLTGKVGRVFEGRGFAKNFSFTSDGKRITMSYSSEETDIFDVESGEKVGSVKNQLGITDSLHKVLLSPDGDMLVIMPSFGYLAVWSTSNWRPIIKIDGKQGSTIGDYSEMTDMAFSRDGKWLATACFNGAVNVWNTKSWSLVATYNIRARENPAVPGGLAFSPDDKWLVITGSIGGTRETGDRLMLYVVDMTSYQVVTEKRLPMNPDEPVFSPSGEVLAVGSIYEVMFFDATTTPWNDIGTIKNPEKTGKNYVFDIAFSPDGRFIYTTSNDGVVRVWGIK